MSEGIQGTGIEPFGQHAGYPKSDRDEVRLVCWLAIQAEAEIP